MNKIKRNVLPCLVLAFLLPAVAGAQDGPWSFGISAGLADINVDPADDAVQLQGLVGYDVWENTWGTLTGELNVGTSIVEGEFDVAIADVEWDVTTIGLAATYRMSDLTFYPLARLGYQYSDLSIDASIPGIGSDSDSESDSGLTAGIGAGFEVAEGFDLELTWTRQFSFFEEDLDVIALGVRF